ncbi:MAG: hypothetical protein ACREV9_11110 [Burkholderiales bacterium]
MIYSISDRIEKIDFPTREEGVIYSERGPGTEIHLSKIDHSRFIFAGTTDHVPREFDRTTGTVKVLGSGYLPTYIPEYRKLFFYRNVKDQNKSGPRLFLADYDHMEKPPQQIGQSLGRMTGWSVVQVSRDEVAFIEPG